MTIRLLSEKDKHNLEEYLFPHKSECMFIYSNLKAAGIEYKEAPFHGEYWGYFNPSKQLKGVIAHYWNGNVMMYSSDEMILEELVVHLKEHTTRPIAGILGPNIQAEFVIQKLGLSNEHFNLNSHEGLYEIDLSDLTKSNIPDHLKIVEAREISRDLLSQWMKQYDIEALGGSKTSDVEQRVAEKGDRLREGDCWVLRENNVPVSLSAFNARLEDIVQVGPVWTPPEYRNKGFARLLLSYILAGEKRKGLQKAVLFTDNPAAIKVYQSIGFKNIGDYRLALLKKPIALG